MKKMVSMLLIIFMFTIILTSEIAHAASIKISKTKATMEVDSALKLKITGTDAKVIWSSSKKSVAVVSSAGMITAKAEGTATITATVNNKKYSCKVTVVDNNKVSPTPIPTPEPYVSPTPVPEPASQADQEMLDEKETRDLALNPTKYLGKYAEFEAEIATDPVVEDGFAYSCLVYQDIKNKARMICLHYFDIPGFKKGDKVLVYGFVENIYTGPGVDENTIEAPIIIVKSMDLLKN